MSDFKARVRRRLALCWPILVLLLLPVVYLLTMASELVMGDPTEYTFVANILGIAHPPGYAFYTILGKVFQILIPVGEIPWRMHLASVIISTAASLFVYGTVSTLTKVVRSDSNQTRWLIQIIALLPALSVGFAIHFWQHSIHANPHILSATFLAANLFFLTKWWAAEVKSSASINDRWLYIFSLSAGLGVTHHPLTVITFPAYTVFILVVRPSIWRDWRTILKMVAFAALGLLVWLYYPIRSAAEPAFGPHDMNTLSGFLDHVLARGLTESLPFFGLSDAGDRALVFWTLLRLQYSLTSIFLAILGGIWLIGHRPSGAASQASVSPVSLRPVGIFYALALVCNYLFVINLRQQDIMAYLLGCFLIIGLLIGPGLLGLLDIIQRRVRLDKVTVTLLLIPIFLLGPVLQLARNLPRASISEYREGSAYVEQVFERFEGLGEGAVLLNDWEHITPLWYSQLVEERWPLPVDVQPEFVSTDLPWVESVYKYFPSGPVYLSGYRKEIVDAGFRLRPRDEFYQVVEPGDRTTPPEIITIAAPSSGEVQVIGFQLPQREFEAGDLVPLTLAMQSKAGTEDYYVPVVTIGEGARAMVMEYTTDSHLVTPQWEPGEVIVERFEFALPHGMARGSYPLNVTLRSISSPQREEYPISLGVIEIDSSDRPISSPSLLANYRQRVGLESARARKGLFVRRSAPWSDPIKVQPGDTVHVTLVWRSLASPEQSYTVFVHLIDLSDRPYVALDYTPLGGSTPTHLWIPKWVPGQRMSDPYQLEIPEGVSPGTYLIEVGLYEMTSGRRLHMSDDSGSLIGDRFILGPVEVVE